jgi:hypothetical protein
VGADKEPSGERRAEVAGTDLIESIGVKKLRKPFLVLVAPRTNPLV